MTHTANSQSTATCGAGTGGKAIGGGTSISGGNGVLGAAAITGDYPSDAAGNAATGPGAATSWTGVAQPGGLLAGTPSVTVFVICNVP
ncbi:MAG: hypothetical protein WBD38_08265 [Candidatus Dormiibacterota bacterium]